MRGVGVVPVLVVLVTACNGDDDGSGGASRPSSPAARIVVTEDRGGLPKKCGVRKTASRIVALFDAANRGDRQTLSSLIADPSYFHWYSVSERGGDTGAAVDLGGGVDGKARTPAGPQQVLGYLLRRHRAGERLHLDEINVSLIPPQGWIDVDVPMTGVEYEVSRRVDPPPTGVALTGGGKGGLLCDDGDLVVWSMGWDARTREALTCPAPRASRGRSRTRTVACAN